MIYEAISILIVFGLMIAIAIPLSALMVAVRAKLNGRYLNRYYVVSRKKGGGYELHHHPMFGLYYARERKFHRFTVDALRKFRSGYPDQTLIATSLTLQSGSRKGIPLRRKGLRLLGGRLMADFLILLNFANYRKSGGEWCFIKLIRMVHGRIPMCYVLIGG